MNSKFPVSVRWQKSKANSFHFRAEYADISWEKAKKHFSPGISVGVILRIWNSVQEAIYQINIYKL